LGKALFGSGLISGVFKRSENPHSHNLVTNTHSAPMATGQQVTVI